MPGLLTRALGTGLPLVLRGLDPFGAATATPAAGRDADVIADVIARLEATGAFDAVFWGEETERRGRPAELLMVALVEPDTWAEVDEFDDLADYQAVPRNTFALTLIARDPDPKTRDRRLDAALGTARNTLNEQSLAGITIPGLTILRRGKWQKPANPERRMTVTGEYAYFINGPTGHDTTD